MSNVAGTGLPLGQGPWWNKTLLVVGPTALIALGLCYALVTGRLVFNDPQVAASVRSFSENFALHHDAQQRMNERIERYMEIQNQLTQQLCVNAARSDDQRAGCFKPAGLR